MALEKLECLGCGARVGFSKDGYYLECAHCGNRYGVPESMSKQRERVVSDVQYANSWYSVGTSQAYYTASPGYLYQGDR